MDGRNKSALKLVDKIYENAIKYRDEHYNDGSENPNAIKAMTNLKHNLSEKEVKEEIFGLILAVSFKRNQLLIFIYFLTNLGSRFINDRPINNPSNACYAQKSSRKSFS